MNLTNHDEWTEMSYIIEQFEPFYKQYVRELPKYKDVYRLFWKKAKECKHRKIIMRLAICYIEGMMK